MNVYAFINICNGFDDFVIAMVLLQTKILPSLYSTLNVVSLVTSATVQKDNAVKWVGVSLSIIMWVEARRKTTFKVSQYPTPIILISS